MDEEENQENQESSLGMYENMERSDIRPDFLSAATGAKDLLKNSEKLASAGGAGAGATAGAAGGAAAAGGTAVAGAATGGVALAAGAALKTAEKVGSAAKVLEDGQTKGKGSGKIKKFAPVAVIFGLIIIGYGVMSLVGQWLFPFGYKSNMMKDWNSTRTSAARRTDALTDSTQLSQNQTSKYAGDETIFSHMDFSNEQIQSFNSAAIKYNVSNDGTKSLSYKDNVGQDVVVVADTSLSMAPDGKTIAAEGATVTDSGANAISYEERVAQILDGLDVAASDAKVVPFSKALRDYQFKDKYIAATNGWRGNISGWYNDMTDTAISRMGISRNNYDGYVVTGDEAHDEEKFIDFVKTKPAGSDESTLDEALGDQSLEDRVKEIAKASEDANCGTSSAFTDIESVLNGDMTARQVSAGMLWLEAIDKTMAGEGRNAPLSVANNIILKSGAADTQGMQNLFGEVALDQKNKELQKVSAQAHGGSDGSVRMNTFKEGGEEEYRQCIYEGNVNEQENKGFISTIGSMFKKIGTWVKNALSGIADAIQGVLDRIKDGENGVKNNTDAVTKTLKKTIKKYNNMKDKTYFDGSDSATLGEALVSSSERIFNEKAKSGAQVTGDNGAVLANYEVQQEVIAEQADYDRRNKSPFDVTNENTFLGSIMYSLIPMAVSNSSVTLSTSISKFGSFVSNSLIKLLPTSNAVDKTAAELSRGDCVYSNSISAVANAYCNNYYNTDFEMIEEKPVEIFDEVVGLRYDAAKSNYGDESTGYIYRNDVSKSSPIYGDGALNDEEDGLTYHWGLPTYNFAGGVGTGDRWKSGTSPHGCESDWEHTTKYEYVPQPDGTTVRVAYEEYDGDNPTAWKYSRATNFEYEGYKTGWPNRTSAGTSAGVEGAKNDKDPGECVLDIKIDDDNSMQPVINENGALNTFLILSGQRGSEWGVADDANIKYLAKTDFIRGRVHPCVVGAKDECEIYEDTWSWTNKEEDIKKSEALSRFIGGTAYVYYTGNSGSMKKGFKGDKTFKDLTRDDDYFWNETKWYQAYVELSEWMESADIVTESGAADAVARYYDENPLNNSRAGIIARYSGKSKEQVVAVLDLFEYMEFLANYDASELYPVPKPAEEKVEYDNGEIVAQNERVIAMAGVVFDELRGRAVASA